MRSIPGRLRLGRESAALVLFVAVVAAVYLASPVLNSGDGRLVIYEAESLVSEGNLDLHEYGGAVDGFPCYRAGERRISRYPWGTAVATAPLLLVADGVGDLLGDDPTGELRSAPPRDFEKTLAAIIATIAALLLVLLGRELTGRLAPGLLLGLMFAFGTALWSAVSRGLWQHGPFIVLASIGLLLLARARNRDDWRLAAVSGLPLAAAFAVRPTASVAIGCMGLLLLFRDRRAAVGYAAAVVVVLVPTVLINQHQYGDLLNPFYFANGGFLGSGLRDTFLTGLAGTMVSPARGLLVYSPFLVLAAAGLAILRRQRRPMGLEVACLVIAVLMWVAASNTFDWPGGWSYGPRLLGDTLPFLAVLLAPVADRLLQHPRTWTVRTAAMGAVLVAGLTWAVFVNLRGALDWSTQTWNTTPPVDVERTAGRYWSWSDAPFLRTGDLGRSHIYPYDTTPPTPDHLACLS